MTIHARPAMPMLAPRQGAFRANRERTVKAIATTVTVLAAAAAVVIVAAAAVAFTIG